MPKIRVRALPMAASLAVLGAVLLHFSPKADAESPSDDNFVYVMSNKTPWNSVIQFSRRSDGSLQWVDEIPTGGRGTGATGVDPLGSQDALVLSGDGHLLLAANAGSNEISVLTFGSRRRGDSERDEDRMSLRDKVWSGGEFPNSIALSGDLVYVLNAKGSSPNITGFRLDPEGSLNMIPGSTVELPAGSTGANDIRFSNGGSKLLVTVSGTNQILVFEVEDDGVASSPTMQASAGASPFGIRFGRNGIAVVSEAAGSASSYSFSATDVLEVISGAVSNTQKASCWLSLNRAATFAYVSDTGSGTISSYQIEGDGMLTLTKAVAATTGGAPIDSALSRDSEFLYVVDSAMGRVVILRVDGGNLTVMGNVPSLPASIQGIAAQ